MTTRNQIIVAAMADADAAANNAAIPGYSELLSRVKQLDTILRGLDPHGLYAAGRTGCDTTAMFAMFDGYEGVF